ncbi:DUF6896 domain-containing protein [Gimesia panareensis]|uniref:DUF6896 domain-containing protein n=1 Tax=Gimesia panareensis TaxID=2527978 RepID=UPI00118BAFF3|nr:hypothetical protein [Gimesia panareensis]QDU53688.1 hypothetical protein Pan110_60820 [Gimesia panareensis]
MQPLAQELIQRLQAVTEDAVSLREFITVWLDRPWPLTPWASWTLFSLIRHRPRQEFVSQIVQERLGVDQLKLAKWGYFGHPEGLSRVAVPGLPEWEYYLHGCGCCLTHQQTGTEIDVDFYDETADWIDLFFYQGFLKSLRQPELWEARVLALHASIDTVQFAFDELQEQEFLEENPEHHACRLSFEITDLIPLLESLTKRHAEPETMLRLAAVIGDSPLVQQLLDTTDIPPEVTAHARRVTAAREQFLQDQYDLKKNQSLALQSLQENQSPDLDDFLKQALKSDNSSTLDTALDIITVTGDSCWCPLVSEVLQRVSFLGSADEFPRPEKWAQPLEFLLRQDYQFDRTIEFLSHVPKYALGEAAAIALEFQPHLALKLFREALRSSIPHNRETAAAILALIDQPWCQRELLQILNESTDQEATAESRAALKMIWNLTSKADVDNWERENPLQLESDEHITVVEALLLKTPWYVEFEMDQWRDRVLPLREIIPPGAE